MRIPSRAGQFRRVRDGNDGSTIYACCWCDRTIEITDNPNYWNFCPLCGKSWFSQLNCRPSETPRWAWDRGITNHWQMSKRSEWEWVIEKRHKWSGEDWSPWEVEHRDPVIPGSLGEWRNIKCTLIYFRGMHIPDGVVDYEYRARTNRAKV